MRRKKAHEQEAPASADGRITPTDVQQVEFRLSVRGYNERDVDAFLDRITEDLSGYLEELERLRAEATAAPASAAAPRSFDAAASEIEAERILGRAHEDAAAIVRQAEQQAAAIRAGASTGSGDVRAAVAPFLNTEREFLQGLGTLVQTHAEEIKQMVLALRSRAAEPEGAPRPVPGQPAPSASADRPPAGSASAAEIRERLGEPGAPTAPPAEERTIVVDPGTEPAYSSEGAPAKEGRERSLRELFWGED